MKLKARGGKKKVTLEERVTATLSSGRAIRDLLDGRGCTTKEVESALAECPKLIASFRAINKDLRAKAKKNSFIVDP